MAHAFANLLTHIIFSTRNRIRVMDEGLRPELFAYLGGIARKLEGKPLIINGTADHIHLLVALPPVVSISEFLRVLKANSSGWVHKKWPSRRTFEWQEGYGAFSVSQSNVSRVVEIHCRPGGASPQGFIPGGICRLSQEKRHPL